MHKLIFISFVLICQHLHAQGIEEKINQYNQAAHQEKLFVHTDKSFYLAGEIVWFKVYNVDGAHHRPTNLSRLAYIEIIDKDNKPVMQGKIALQKGKGNGSFYLPASLNSGNYRLRGYTRWMRNFSAALYFEKPISIVNSLKPLTRPAADTAPRYQIAFFPEGGNLVSDLESKVAFKVTDEYGSGVEASGWLLSDKNDTLTQFATHKFGMGHFSYTPVAGRRYKVVIAEQKIIQELPAAQAQGYVMRLNEGRLTITSKGIGNQPVLLVVQSHQRITLAEKQTLNNGVAEFQIDTGKLAEGISYLTVFDARQQPVCERLYFKKPVSMLPIAAASSAAQYGTRQRVAVTVETNGTPADLSLAVYRVNAWQQADSTSIAYYLWLTAELGEGIESPAYYFTSNSSEAAENLVLVHGWRRFKWHEVLAGHKPVFRYQPEQDGHLINARLVNPTNEQPIAGMGSFLSVPGTQIQFYNAKSDSSGNLLFDVRNYYGQNEIILQTDGSTTDYRIDVENPFSETYSSAPARPFRLHETNLDAINEQSIAMQVLNAYEGTRLSQFALPSIDTFPFYGRTAKRYKLDEYTRFTTMEEVLREYVSEVSLRRNDGQFHFAVYNNELKSFYPPDPLVLLDGVKVSSHAAAEYDPLKVRVLDVVQHKYYHGNLTYNGIVSLTTYHGDMPGLKLDPRSVILDYEGLQLQREFYAPAYKTEQQASSRLPDFRNLLYWSPSVITGKDGRASVEFYTSDLKGQYIAVLQGLDDNGRAGSTWFSFEVK